MKQKQDYRSMKVLPETHKMLSQESVDTGLPIIKIVDELIRERIEKNKREKQ